MSGSERDARRCPALLMPARFVAFVMTTTLFGSIVYAEDSLEVTLKRFNAARKAVPADVGSYMDRAEACWHFAGEEAYDAARRIEIDRALAELACAGLKSDEAALRREYAGSPAVLSAIDTAAALE